MHLTSKETRQDMKEVTSLNVPPPLVHSQFPGLEKNSLKQKKISLEPLTLWLRCCKCLSLLSYSLGFVFGWLIGVTKLETRAE